MSQYVLLPPRGVRARMGDELNFFVGLPFAQSTLPPRPAQLRWQSTRGPWEGLDISIDEAIEREHIPESVIPLQIIDTVHEDGPKLVELSEESVLKLRLATPFLRLAPDRDYHPQVVSPLPLTLSPNAAGAPPTIVEVRGGPARATIADAQVTAVTDLRQRFGDRGTTDRQGCVALLLGPPPARVEELRVEPPPSGYWGAYRGALVLHSPYTLNLEPIDLSAPDSLRHFYKGATPGASGHGVKVAVIDSGIDLAHPDLVVAAGANTVTGEPAGDYGDNGLGHGTHVAGIIAARGAMPVGLQGLAPDVELLSYRVYGANLATAKTYAIMKALIYATDAGCHLINLSLGALPPDDGLKDAIDDANERGAVVIAAAGNAYRQPVSVPACYGVAISALGRTGTFPAGALEDGDIDAPVGIDADDFVAGFSNVGSDIDFIAPGVGILSTVPGGYAPGRGTSMAAAAATGMSARLLSAAPHILAMPADHARSAAMRNLLGNAAKSRGFGLVYEGYGML